MPREYRSQDEHAEQDAHPHLENLTTYQIDEQQFTEWQLHWDSRQEVIEHLLRELDRAMAQSRHNERPTFRIVRP